MWRKGKGSLVPGRSNHSGGGPSAEEKDERGGGDGGDGGDSNGDGGDVGDGYDVVIVVTVIMVVIIINWPHQMLSDYNMYSPNLHLYI